MKKCQYSLNADIRIHDPSAAGSAQLFKPSGELISAADTGSRKKQHSCYWGEQYAGKRNNNKHHRGDHSLFQIIIPFSVLKPGHLKILSMV